MKIAVITNLYPPISRGGAEKVAQRIVGELSQRGHEVVVISTMPFYGYNAFSPQIKESLSETVYRFFPPNVYYVLNDYKKPYLLRAVWHAVDLFSPFATKAVVGILRAERVEIVLTHNLKGFGMQAPQAMRKLGIPFIHTVHDIQLSVPSGLLIYGEPMLPFENFLRRPYELAVRRAIGKPNLVISPSKFLADFYRQRGFFKGTEVKVLRNPAPEMHGVPRRTARGGAEPTGPLRLLFAAQLERHKGIEEILEAVKLSKVPVELHIAGDGTFRSLVEESCKTNPDIVYHGYVSLGDLERLFSIVDATVVPSRCFENSPTIIYESLQCGVPVIASDVGGIGELLKHGQNGYLVEPGNAQALAEAIKKMSEELPVFRASEEIIRNSVSNCSLKAYVDELEKMMKEILKK
ncbi:MAG: glycosyltransferase family 4 protein [Patescibacteria group bacterium]|jgi:glycosyltransferase involved in cell wall biosynthesis